MIKTITGFLQRLLFINRKVLLAVKDGEDYGEESMIYTYGLSLKERIALAVTIICEIFKLSYSYSTSNINITINNKKDL